MIQNNNAKVLLKYHSGGFGTIDNFYTEKLTISTNSIEYKKEWDINKKEHYNLDLDSKYFERRLDISWKIKGTRSDFVQVLHEVCSYIDDHLGERFIRDDVCDGDDLDYILMTPDGRKIINHFSPCAHYEIMETLSNYIVPFITDGLPIPSFLEIYREEDE